MALDVQRSLDFGGLRRLLNLPNAASPQEPATLAQVNALVEGLGWKDNVRVATQGNTNLAAPGAAIDGITMAANDRVLVRAQTTAAENGIYIWNGAAVAMTRALDASTADELENAVVGVDEGTSAGASYRQQTVNFVLDTNDVVWGSFGSNAGPASDTSAGVVELATQGEVDAGVDTARAVTPAGLAGSVYASRKFNATIGDGTATSYVVTHNLNTRDVVVEVYRNSGNYDTVLAEVQRTSVNAVTIVVDTALASNALRVVVRA
jgi:hypothetical protein